MKRKSEIFLSEADATSFAASLPDGSEAVVIEEKNTEDSRLGSTTAQCRTLWWKVCYNESPLPWRRSGRAA
jgi:hypothetical protein